MGDISPNFNRSEFRCRCGCGFATVDCELLDILEELRNHFGRPVHITSGCRCPQHNYATGGQARSRHLEGRAADIVVSGIKAHRIYEYLISLYPDRYGFGRYEHFTHVDSRSKKARW